MSYVERRKCVHARKLLANLVLVGVLVLAIGMAALPNTKAATPIYVRPGGDDTNCNGTVNVDYPGSGGPGLDCAVKTIQKGVDLVDIGGTVNVAAGTYDEQVVIVNSLTLQGVGDTTIIEPSSAAKLTTVLDGYFSGGTKQIAGIAVANVSSGASVTVKSLKVDGSSVTTAPAGAGYVAGIFYRETGGSIDTVTVVDMTVGATGTAIRGYGAYLSAVTNTVSVEVKGSTFTNYDKNGIDAHGNKLTASIHDNTIAGRGLLGAGDEVQNGVNISDWTVGTVNDNTISNMASTQAWASCGILFFNNGGTANGNTITDCQSGIVFQDGNATAEDNIVNGGTVGLRGLNWQRNPGFTGTFTVSFKGNTITGISDRIIGVTPYDGQAIAVYARPSFSCTLTVDSNQLLGGGATSADGIYVGADNGIMGVTTIRKNTISNWQHGIYLESLLAAGSTITGNTIENNTGAGSGVHVEAAVNAANVHLNFNNIVGNTGSGAYGVSNLGSGTLDAEKNWWGSATGPTDPSNPGGTGDAVSDNVDFTPWLGGQSKTETVTDGTLDAKLTADTEVGVLGTATVTVAKYASNPGEPPTFSALGSYVDVHVDDVSAVTEITVKLYYTSADVAGHVESTLKLYWWSGAAWEECSDSGVTYPAGGPTYRGYIWAKTRSDTIPNLSQLTGTPFGGGSPSLANLAGFTSRSTGDVLLVIGDIALNPHGSKPPGVFYQQGRDTTPLGYLRGMVNNTQPCIFDTNAAVNATNGRPAGDWPLIFAVGGPDINAVAYYYEHTGVAADRAPVTWSEEGSNVIWRVQNGTVVANVTQASTNVPPGTSDVFAIQILRDADGRLVVLMYGERYTGTWAAAEYFKFTVYPTITSWTNSYYIVQWTDAASGTSANMMPDSGDTFTILAQGG
jgi:parallel beta-helix repeat protein